MFLSLQQKLTEHYELQDKKAEKSQLSATDNALITKSSEEGN